MTNYREILWLSSLQYSQRIIESKVHCSRHTVRDVLQTAKAHGISWPLSDAVTNTDLEWLLFPDKHKASSQYVELEYPYIHRELARPGVTLTLLWEEYCAKRHEAGQKPYINLSLASDTSVGHALQRQPCVSSTSRGISYRWTGSAIRFPSKIRSPGNKVQPTCLSPFCPAAITPLQKPATT